MPLKYEHVSHSCISLSKILIASEHKFLCSHLIKIFLQNRKLKLNYYFRWKSKKSQLCLMVQLNLYNLVMLVASVSRVVTVSEVDVISNIVNGLLGVDE